MGLYAITGGATGIGAAIKQQLRDARHQVLVIDIAGDDTDIQADLSSAEGRLAAIDAIKAAAPDGLDGWVPCAGVRPKRPRVSSSTTKSLPAPCILVNGMRMGALSASRRPTWDPHSGLCRPLRAATAP